MNPTSDFSTLLSFFKALANESRLKLLGLVAQREHSVQELATLLGLTEPTASHHLTMLKALGLVSLRPDGNTHWYALEPAVLARLSKSLLSREQIMALAEDIPPTAWETRVLAGFVLPDGRLKEIPAS